MNFQPYAIGLAVALAITGLGFGGLSLSNDRAARVALALSNQRQAQMDRQLSQKQGELTQHRRELAAMKRQQADAQARAAKSAELRPVARMARAADLYALMAANPQLHELQLQTFRANLVHRFGQMYSDLGLSPAQIAKFEDMATAHEDDRENIFTGAVKQGVDPDGASVGVLHDQYMNQYYDSLGSEFGPQLQQAVMQLDSTRNQIISAQGFVEQSDLLVGVGGTPYTAEQRAQLIQIVANSAISHISNGGIDLKSVDWQKAQAQAATILNESQLKAFEAQFQVIQLSNKAQAFFAQPK